MSPDFWGKHRPAECQISKGNDLAQLRRSLMQDLKPEANNYMSAARPQKTVRMLGQTHSMIAGS